MRRGSRSSELAGRWPFGLATSYVIPGAAAAVLGVLVAVIAEVTGAGRWSYLALGTVAVVVAGAIWQVIDDRQRQGQ